MAQPLGYTPVGVFKGRNFMTPAVDSYYDGYYAGHKVYIELSHGSGMSHETIYGVTVRKTDGTEFKGDEDPSKCVFSLREAREYIDTFQR